MLNFFSVEENRDAFFLISNVAKGMNGVKNEKVLPFHSTCLFCLVTTSKERMDPKITVAFDGDQYPIDKVCLTLFNALEA